MDEQGENEIGGQLGGRGRLCLFFFLNTVFKNITYLF